MDTNIYQDLIGKIFYTLFDRAVHTVTLRKVCITVTGDDIKTEFTIEPLDFLPNYGTEVITEDIFCKYYFKSKKDLLESL